MASSIKDDITAGASTLSSAAIAKCLISTEQKSAIDGAETAFEKVGKFVQILSEVTKNDPIAMGKFMGMLKEEGLDPKMLKEFVQTLTKQSDDNKLIEELGELAITCTSITVARLYVLDFNCD